MDSEDSSLPKEDIDLIPAEDPTTEEPYVTTEQQSPASPSGTDEPLSEETPVNENPTDDERTKEEEMQSQVTVDEPSKDGEQGSSSDAGGSTEGK